MRCTVALMIDCDVHVAEKENEDKVEISRH